MKTSVSVCTLVVTMIAWSAVVNPLTGQELEFKLDHFKVYQVESAERVEDTVALKGQFDKEYKQARVSGPLFFSNPVSKNGGRIRDPNAHLNWYRIRQQEREPTRAVSVVNQFGKQQLMIDIASLLAVPTKKSHEGKTYVPEELDHYKVYRVIKGKPVNRKVALVDQFDREENIAIRPVLFCVPVSKQHGDRTTEIVNERDHLVVYLMERRKSEVKFETSDQFGVNTLKTVACPWICVPSLKTKYEEIDPDDDTDDSSTSTNLNFRLDHFKVYEVEAAKPVEAVVALKGQFDRGFLKAEIAGPVFFSNNVSKNGARIYDPNAHLNWYKLAGEKEPQRKVGVVNQFGEQTVLVDQPAFLLAPAKKTHDRKTYPTSARLDHFKAYKVIEGKKIGKTVTLVDQFGEERNVVIQPVLFCVPVAKQHGDRTTKIVNQRDHLVVYALNPEEHEVKFETSDQFGTNTQKTMKCVWLCVPTLKLKWATGG